MCLAVPGQITRIIDNNDPLNIIGKVSFGGVIKDVNLAYVPEAKIGDYVIVHVGFALTILDQEEAEQTLQDLKVMATIDN
jgi:hydrogenase expression/formation protein HypC